MKSDIRKSISELGGWQWRGAIPEEGTHSGTELRFYKLHRIPVSELDLADIRFLIGQNEALETLVPLALDHLKEDFFCETDYYPGDLLMALLQINDVNDYWKKHPEEKELLRSLYEINIERDNLDEALRKRIEKAFLDFR